MNILFVEDDHYIGKNLANHLSGYGVVTVASNVYEAQEILYRSKFDLAFIDLNLGISDLDGLKVAPIAIQKGAFTVILTSQNEDRKKELSFQAGCQRYFIKSKFLDDPKKFVDPIIASFSEGELNTFFETEFITQDKELIDSVKRLYRVVKSGSHNILLSGETGTGKTTIAKLIHKISGVKGPFIHLNIGEIKEELLESELFGHKKGSFTGAIADKKGYFEEANGGTLFLDEIDSLPKNLQVKIQVALEERKITRLGETTPRDLEFNLTTASCQNLPKLIEEGLFRQDFYFRIASYEMTIPPLRDRVGDIILLVNDTVSKFSSEIFFDSKAIELIKSYDWPGNVRQLRDTIKKFETYNLYHILAEDVLKILNIKKENNAELLTRKQKDFIYQNGLTRFLDSIEMEMMKDAIKKVPSKTAATQLLGIGNRKGTRIYQKAFKAGFL
ncbi:MAG: sigma-54-dependent transcriptional regulator [Bacteriovoracia bacterium]